MLGPPAPLHSDLLITRLECGFNFDFMRFGYVSPNQFLCVSECIECNIVLLFVVW